ncbi:hypothetical protein CC1G_06682 [Coprinopsis cinerea okayama7|uniref:LysM domain-containing protein n=1 Tax=Coprinopsis cinerea (strain Okayama-7 / 130 / ATCC MYA-4618 / FGSC 9003) TaxID=240176 RepID=A8P804_COPC7|nr:hypothetical protein CC1G_06682 [Coprinopsis cinerea okayama7\|eukprot:XP_001839469.2 hypothetical protein CC1G_06682 [Coprinopsis cinerea okayama7\
MALVAVRTQPSPCRRTYQVQSGDYCDKIADEQGVSSYQLAAVNAGVINADCSNLWPGHIICLARGWFDCSPVVKVNAGDTCDAIAAAAGITFNDLRFNNPNINEACSNIYPDSLHPVATVLLEYQPPTWPTNFNLTRFPERATVYKHSIDTVAPHGIYKLRAFAFSHRVHTKL